MSDWSLFKTRNQQKYTNQEKLQLADTVAKKKVVGEGMGVPGFVDFVKTL